MTPPFYRWMLFGMIAALLTGGCTHATGQRSTAPAKAPESKLLPPQPKREFRGVWIATVDNIDWPSRKGLSVAEQKAELIALLDRAAQLKLNAIVFQVRPQCDALYVSALEPWSEFLTGQMGKAPETPFDPLAFVIAESHRRGMELHAWFNPYRALHPANKGPVSNNHISKTKPHLVRKVGRYLWLDPGEREVQDYSLAVVMDVVKRYNVDGVHFDDYFYPYPEKDASGKELEFPDEASWQKYGVKSGLSRDDWRRENANQFIQRVHQAVKAEKPWVKFGISPFGIWRPGHPPQIQGFDQYGKLYADARKWLVNGWLDYFAPQLYWPIEQRAQSYPVLLNWWNQQNPKRLHIWPGLAIYKTSGRDGWKPEEIVRQVQLAAQQPVSAGHIHFSMKHFGRNPALMTALQNGPYAEPALIPASPWLKCAAPQKPTLTLTPGATLKASWSAPGEPPSVWLLQWRQNGQWRTEIIAGQNRAATLRIEGLEAVAVSAVNRAGILSAPAVQTPPR